MVNILYRRRLRSESRIHGGIQIPLKNISRISTNDEKIGKLIRYINKRHKSVKDSFH